MLADTGIDEAWIDMVLAAVTVRMLPEYKPRFDDEMSGNGVDDDSMSAGLSTTMLGDLINKAIGEDKDVVLKLYK